LVYIGLYWFMALFYPQKKPDAAGHLKPGEPGHAEAAGGQIIRLVSEARGNDDCYVNNKIILLIDKDGT
jgi:hypothetical protein